MNRRKKNDPADEIGYVGDHPLRLAPITDRPLWPSRGPAVTVLLPSHRTGIDALIARYGRI